ncbi:MAG: CHAD domain-containing protein [Planctomycetota bacterium]
MDKLPIDDATRALAARYIRKQVNQLRKRLGDLPDPPSPKPVHKARVATRRLKAALAMLGEAFDPDDVHRWDEELKVLRKRLGPARDCDVQIRFLRTTRKKASRRDRPGVELLLEESRKQRRRQQPKVAKAARALQKSGVLDEMKRRMKRVQEAFDDDGPLLTETVFLRCRDAILHRLDALTDKAYVLEDADDHHGHHQMRIAAKHLRYTLEIARGGLGDVVAPMQEAAEQVQDILGDIHDCDVWVDHLQELLSGDGTALDEATRPGVEMLSAERREHRRERFAEMRALWATIREENIEGELRMFLQRDPAELVDDLHV